MPAAGGKRGQNPQGLGRPEEASEVALDAHAADDDVLVVEGAQERAAGPALAPDHPALGVDVLLEHVDADIEVLH
jgi:hypothetical protein